MTSRRIPFTIIILLISAIILLSGCGTQVPEPAAPTEIPVNGIPSTTTGAIPQPTNTNVPAIEPTPFLTTNLQKITPPDNNEELQVLEGQLQEVAVLPFTGVMKLEFSPNSQFLKVRTDHLGEVEGIHYIDLATGEIVLTVDTGDLDLPRPRVYFFPNGTSVAVIRSHELVEYDLNTGQAIRDYQSQYYIVSMSPDGRLLVVVDLEKSERDYTIFKIVDWQSDQEIHSLISEGDFILGFTEFNPAGEIFAATYGIGMGPIKTTFWDVTSGETLHTLQTYGQITFAPDGNLIAATVPYGGYISILDTNTWEQIRYFGEGGEIDYRNPKYTADGNLLYLVREDSAKFWDPLTGKSLGNLFVPQRISIISFSPDMKMIATSVRYSNVTIWGIMP